MTIKGYVVRGIDLTSGDGADVWAMAGGERLVMVDERRFATEWPDLADAQDALTTIRRWRDVGLGDVRIFAVAEDGTETEVPSYAEVLAEVERLRAEHGEALAALRKLFVAARALLAARETSYQDSRTIARTSAARLRDLDEVSEDVRHLAEDDRAEHACPDCGEDARGADHEGME